MTKKFTEEQYQKIIDIYRSSNDYVDAIGLVIDYIDELHLLRYEEALAIANPLTREWAHDKFVDKEKRYVWKLNRMYLVKAIDDGSIFFGSCDAAMALSESQVKEWGFNPDLFDKEEV